LPAPQQLINRSCSSSWVLWCDVRMIGELRRSWLIIRGSVSGSAPGPAPDPAPGPAPDPRQVLASSGSWPAPPPDPVPAPHPSGLQAQGHGPARVEHESSGHIGCHGEQMPSRPRPRALTRVISGLSGCFRLNVSGGATGFADPVRSVARSAVHFLHIPQTHHEFDFYSVFDPAACRFLRRSTAVLTESDLSFWSTMVKEIQTVRCSRGGRNCVEAVSMPSTAPRLRTKWK